MSYTCAFPTVKRVLHFEFQITFVRGFCREWQECRIHDHYCDVEHDVGLQAVIIFCIQTIY